MTCIEFEELIQAQCDLHALSLHEELLGHATICGSCQMLMQQLERIEAVTVLWGEIQPSDDFSSQVLDAFHASTEAESVFSNVPSSVDAAAASVAPFNRNLGFTPRRGSIGPTFLALVASAIAVCVMLGVSWHTSRNAAQIAQRRSIDSNRVIAPPSSPSQLHAGVHERQLDVLIHDAREAYSALASQALQHVSTASFLLPPEETTAPFRANDSMNEFPDSLSRPLSPLGNELRDAVDSLFDRIFTSKDSST